MKIAMVLVLMLFVLLVPLPAAALEVASGSEAARWWPIQSIDTVKFSRDLAREWRLRPDAGSLIEEQVRMMADSGATHITVSTPYDPEFRPYLELWVNTARQYSLGVWFRGNFSGWEGWFGYPGLSREDHLQLTEQFISENPTLFADGDLFEPCPECENGAGGDPRRSGDIQGHRDFLIREYEATRRAFASIGKSVRVVFSMNGDVSRAVMNPQTTEALGGLVTVDHYRRSPQTLAQELRDLAQMSGGEVLLGEFGAPIPDIHGLMTEGEQAAWLNQVLSELSAVRELVGVNYWVGFDGTTSLWRSDGSPKAASFILADYYHPEVLSVEVLDALERPIAGAQVKIGPKETTTDADGRFVIQTTHLPTSLDLSAQGYRAKTVAVSDTQPLTLVLENEAPSFLFRLRIWLRSLLRNNPIRNTILRDTRNTLQSRFVKAKPNQVWFSQDKSGS